MMLDVKGNSCRTAMVIIYIVATLRGMGNDQWSTDRQWKPSTPTPTAYRRGLVGKVGNYVGGEQC